MYGESHRSYTCLDILLKYGSDLGKITFIRPVISDPALFNDPFVSYIKYLNTQLLKLYLQVAEQTERILKRSKIKVLNHYTFTGWTLDDDNTVSTVTVQSENCIKQLQCSFFINFEILIVARNTIKGMSY